MARRTFTFNAYEGELTQPLNTTVTTAIVDSTAGLAALGGLQGSALSADRGAACPRVAPVEQIHLVLLLVLLVLLLVPAGQGSYRPAAQGLVSLQTLRVTP